MRGQRLTQFGKPLEKFDLEQANQALLALREGRIAGRTVLQPSIPVKER
jgi:hypothetical protein